MANVNLKTDFKNGETLFDYQLNNNFKAIEAALEAMNAIVWQDNADKVVTFRGTTEELMNREIIDGQILYDTTTGESYIDYEGKRISTGSGNAIHIGDTEPTNASTQLWINEDELAGVGSEVVNSLEGNEERMAPSVAAVNKALEEHYSTEEQFTGKYWIDGKKIYRKVLQFTYTSAGTHNESLSDLDFDYITIKDFQCKTGKFRLKFYGSSDSNDNVNIFINGNILSIINGGSWANAVFIVILEYTKTTDTVEESEV